LIASIREALAPLHGLPLWDAGRAANMLWLLLGARVNAPTSRDPNRVTGEYALHLQCPWRVSFITGIVAGSSDMYVPADPEADEESFRWDRPGDAVADANLKRWIAAHSAAPLVVTAVDVDRCGGFVLQLSQEFAVEVFPTASSEPHDIREQWRLLMPGVEAAHFVLQNQGPGYE
jgi:hypothetical protein